MAGSLSTADTLLSAVTTTGAGAAVPRVRAERVVHAAVTGTGAVAATVEVYGAIDPPTDETDCVLLGTITLSGTDKDVDGFGMDAPWGYLLAKVTAISGTGAAVTCKTGFTA